jgi:hypothetical protein
MFLFVLSAASCWGCGSKPEPAPPMTSELQQEIDANDALVDQEESNQG